MLIPFVLLAVALPAALCAQSEHPSPWVLPPSYSIPDISYRSEIILRGGSAWQALVHDNLSSPDERLMDRQAWIAGLRFTYAFADLPVDDDHRHDVSRRLLPASRVAVEVVDQPVMAYEPDEFRVLAEGAMLLSPVVALGGRAMHVSHEGELRRGTRRGTYPVEARGASVALLADIWICPSVAVSASAGGGRYTRDGDLLGLPSEGTLLCVGHGFFWGMGRTVSYSHELRVEEWENFRFILDGESRIEIAFAPRYVGRVGLRVANLYTREFDDRLSLGISAAIRYHFDPRFHAELSAASFGEVQLFSQRDQNEVQLALGVRI